MGKEVITVYVTKETRAWLNDLCKRDNRSLTNMVNHIMQEWRQGRIIMPAWDVPFKKKGGG